MTAKPGQYLSYVTVPFDDNKDVISDDVANMFPGKGEFVVFSGRNGYESERQHALKTFAVGQALEVEFCEIGDSRSKLSFVGIPGYWNSVMFENLDKWELLG